MEQLSSSTMAISTVIAVVLFAVATFIEGERPAPEPPPEEVTPQMIREVRPDTAVRDDQDAQSCKAAETALMARVEAAQACEVDADCTILDYGYPIQCLTSIAQDQVSAVRLQYRSYEESCTYRVYYDCPSEPLERVPVCQNNRCVVELRTNDQLKQLTLDYINRQNRQGPN